MIVVNNWFPRIAIDANEVLQSVEEKLIYSSDNVWDSHWDKREYPRVEMNHT